MIVDEKNFIKQMKKRNPKALDFVVDNYSNLVFKVVHNVLNSSFHSQYVEECANDIFWSIWTNIQSFQEEKGNFKSWIIAISKYKAIDYKRKLFKHSTVECINDYSLSDDKNTEETIVLKEDTEELMKAIDCMKQQDKEIFIRRYFLCEEIENIAKDFGVNRNSIDKRLSRGRKFLKEKIICLEGDI